MKKIKVDKVKCIGCGACVGLDSEHFDFDDAGLSEVISEENLETEELQSAVEGCPTGAIVVEDDTNTTEVNSNNEDNA